MPEVSKEVDHLQIIEEEWTILGMQIFARQPRNNERAGQSSQQAPA